MTSVACKMRSNELSDFGKGVIIRYHKYDRFETHPRELNYPKSTVVYVIQKGKVNDDFQNIPRVGKTRLTRIDIQRPADAA